MSNIPNATIQFRTEWGDHAAGAKVSFPEPFARHLVECGLASFVEAAAAAPAPEPVERAEAPKAKHVQRATK